VTRTLAVVNQKGGVGKTTTAVNVAAGLALAERPTLLVDLDPQGNATTGLGVQKSGLYPTVYHVLLGNEPTEKAIHATALSNSRSAFRSLPPLSPPAIGIPYTTHRAPPVKPLLSGLPMAETPTPRAVKPEGRCVYDQVRLQGVSPSRILLSRQS